ncbi:MAG: hypothetical protein GPJ54_20855 [Candidatus Heimdallarchaeota archaeon]|nr:hypothetical protein [Candidatus Heimdallarchaeota archaeon]
MKPMQLISPIISSILLLNLVFAQPILSTTLGIVAVEISDNEYWIQTSSLITIADVELGFTGLTSFEVDGIEQQLMGDLFILVDGRPDRITGMENGTMQLPLTKGYHSISLLYMGKDNYGTIYSMDTIHVDLSSSYSKPDPTAYDFYFTVNDAVVVGEKVDHTISYTDFSYRVRDLTLDGGITANISVDENKIVGAFNINTYGSDILQSETQFPATRGQIFFVDDIGIHKNPEQLYFENEINIGVLVIHEAGVMLGDDYDGIMVDDATGSFDYYIEYQSFDYSEPMVETTPFDTDPNTSEDPTGDPTKSTLTPQISTRESIYTSNEDVTPLYLPPFILLILWRRKR